MLNKYFILILGQHLFTTIHKVTNEKHNGTDNIYTATVLVVLKYGNMICLIILEDL